MAKALSDCAGGRLANYHGREKRTNIRLGGYDTKGKQTTTEGHRGGPVMSAMTLGL